MAGAAAAAFIANAQAALLRRFEAAGATTPATAIAFAPRNRLFDRRLFARLQRHGAVVETAPGRFYLDRAGWDRSRAATRKRLLGVLAVLSAVTAGIIALG